MLAMSVHALPPSLYIKVHNQSFYFEPSLQGITVGTDPTNNLRFLHDPLVEQFHATLEHTPLHGIWVLVDHSNRGTYVKNEQQLRKNAVVIHDGDGFRVGNTKFFIHFGTSPRQNIAASPIAGHHSPRNLTKKSSLSMIRPEYTNSPVPKQKLKKSTASETVFSFDSTQDSSEDTTPIPIQPPFEYSASPSSHRPSTLVQSNKPAPSKRDDLRIQVSKKMAKLMPKDIHPPQPSMLPMSPVPQSQLRQQHQLLQIQIAKKSKEDAWLHQQQKEYLQGPSPSTRKQTRKSFSLDIQSPRSPITREDYERNDALSSVSSSAATEIACFRHSFGDISSENEENNDDLEESPPFQLLDVTHLRSSFDTLLNTPHPLTLNRRPNPPPDYDDRLHHVRMKRAHLVRTTPVFQMALHSPYKTAKHVQDFMDSSAAPSPTHFDYTM